ncbi:MAG TPA: hypothetical protein VIN34_11170 [Candidatus Limnocylindria bacterium]|jgi:hypothetical protein
MLPLTRVCARCHTEKPLDAFPIKDNVRGTRRSYCVPCRSDYGKAHYRQHRSDYLAKNIVARVRHRDANRDLVYDHLLTHPCVDCGESDPVVLDFDHVDPSTKLWTVGKMLSRQATPAIEREIEKCVVRCANCHRVRTAAQFGSYRVEDLPSAYSC